MKGIFVLLILASVASVAYGGSWEQARELYQQGKFKEATEALATIASDSAEIESALGAAWFKQQDLGRAVVHYRKALQLRPRDPDLHFNLSFVRGRTRDRIEGGTLWSVPVSGRESALMAAFLSFLTGLAGAGWWLTRRKFWRPVGMALGAAASVATVLAVLAQLEAPFGAVVAGETLVRSGPGETYSHLFTIHSGTEFDLQGREGDWIRVRLSDGKRGWMKATDGELGG